jgi:hypothetical protein
MSERLIRRSCHDAAALGILRQAGNTSAADSVDETAKCAATFSVLTNIGVLDAGLGKQFSFYSALAYAMTVFYSDADRERGLTITETSFLISEYQISIDHAEGNGEAFIPYVASVLSLTHLTYFP